MRYIFIIVVCLHTAKLFGQTGSFPKIGVVQHLEADSLLHAAGYALMVASTARLFSPLTVTEETFQRHVERIDALRVPLFGANIFIPGSLKVVGPEVDEDAVLSYADVVFRRASAAGVRMIVWGSAGSRAVPDGFDREKARAQFVSIARKVATLADGYDVMVALENLNRDEVNFINSVDEAMDIVKAVDHRNFRLCADIYHMLRENESPQSIIRAGAYIVYCEVAEEEGRAAPGVHHEDFRPYFSALREIGYTGNVVIECRWTDLASQAPGAIAVLREQLRDVFGR